jgi:hypothetical protein
MPTETQTAKRGSGERIRDPDPETASAAGRALGSIKTEKKAEAARRNGLLAKNGGRPLKPLLEIPCTCRAADPTVAAGLEGHKTYCLRFQAIKRRQKAGKL